MPSATLSGSTTALVRLADMREAAGDREGAEELARIAADAGDTHAMARVAIMREMAGHRRQADEFARLAADAGNPSALARAAELREGPADDREWTGRSGSETEGVERSEVGPFRSGNARPVHRTRPPHGWAPPLAGVGAHRVDEAGG